VRIRIKSVKLRHAFWKGGRTWTLLAHENGDLCKATFEVRYAIQDGPGNITHFYFRRVA
jgi:hypothetical protein